MSCGERSPPGVATPSSVAIVLALVVMRQVRVRVPALVLGVQQAMVWAATRQEVAMTARTLWVLVQAEPRPWRQRLLCTSL